jgi:hypothetical protein
MFFVIVGTIAILYKVYAWATFVKKYYWLRGLWGDLCLILLTQ